MQQQKNGPGISSVGSIYLRHKLSRFIHTIKKYLEAKQASFQPG
jgi:hypothetical protein